jgi:hypothetical protein
VHHSKNSSDRCNNGAGCRTVPTREFLIPPFPRSAGSDSVAPMTLSDLKSLLAIVFGMLLVLLA